jgi:hypothetical protein
MAWRAMGCLPSIIIVLALITFVLYAIGAFSGGIHNTGKNLKTFLLGAATYPTLEILWRGHTHWTMGVVGGACFVCICKLASRMSKCATWKKCLAGTCAITSIELRLKEITKQVTIR